MGEQILAFCEDLRGEGVAIDTSEIQDAFRALEIVRVYTKAPGKPADTDKPFTVRRGGTVLDVARLVHRDIEQGLKFARMWGDEVFDGQQVGPEHTVSDGDTVELHF